MSILLIKHPILIVVVAGLVWFGAQMILSVLVAPYRAKLRQGLALLEKSGNLNARELEFIDHLWRTAISVRSAILLSFAYISGLTMSRESILREMRDAEEAQPNFWRDRRVDDLMDWYFVSIFAANPLFGLVSLVLRAGWRLKVMYVLKSVHKDSFEAHLSALPPFEAALKA